MRKPIFRIFACTLLLALSIAVAQRADAWWWNSDYTETRYPIVLAHGFLGFESVMWIMDYWPGIPRALERDGADVYITLVSAVNTSEVRGEQLLAQIEDILAATGERKVNLIGHSQGTLDARYVASVRPDLIASVTSIAGPHNGGVDAFPTDGERPSTDLFGLIGDLLSFLGGNPTPNDVEAALRGFSDENIIAFAAKYPMGLPTTRCGDGPSSVTINGHKIRLYSWSGTGLITTGVDPTDYIFALSSDAYDEANDGLVGRCDSHFGRVLRDNYFHNHLDEVNGLFGLVPLFESNPKSIFRSHANRLKKAGL